MPLGEIVNTLHLAQDSIVSPKQAEMMSAVVDEIQGVRCNFCEDGGGVFITSSDGIRFGCELLGLACEAVIAGVVIVARSVLLLLHLKSPGALSAHHYPPDISLRSQ